VLIGLAIICIVLSVPVYLVLPTQWSSVCGVFSGAVQAFVLLQVASIDRGL
jgi:hypothetical protein